MAGGEAPEERRQDVAVEDRVQVVEEKERAPEAQGIGPFDLRDLEGEDDRLLLPGRGTLPRRVAVDQNLDLVPPRAEATAARGDFRGGAGLEPLDDRLGGVDSVGARPVGEPDLAGGFPSWREIPGRRWAMSST